MQYKEKKIHELDLIIGIKELNSSQKLVLFKLYLLDNSERGCFASNKYLSDMFGMSEDYICKILKSLADAKLIERVNEYRPEGTKRSISVKLEQLKKDPPVHDYRPDKTIVQDPPVHEHQPYTKEITKEKTKEKENVRPFDFLSNNYSLRLEAWENKYMSRLIDFEKFKTSFNNEVDIRDMEYNPDILFNFMTAWANGFIKNSKKYDDLNGANQTFKNKRY